jgi:catechol 2,3-dioxygenase-like lactoylglutathione lyase family enzyme
VEPFGRGDTLVTMVSGVNHITLSVSDLERAFRFYVDLLGLRPVARWYKGAHLTAGDLWVCLSLESDIIDRSLSQTYDHIALSVSDADFSPLRDRLLHAGVFQWQQNHSEGDSFYFLDPDGHKLEIHVTSLPDRINSLRQRPPKDLVLFS